MLLISARPSMVLGGQQRLTDKLDFLSFLESTGREFKAKLLNFSIDEPCAPRLSPETHRKAHKAPNSDHLRER